MKNEPTTIMSSCFTPLKTNIAPENQWLEDVFPTEIVPLGDMLVFGVVCQDDWSKFAKVPFFRLGDSQL